MCGVCDVWCVFVWCVCVMFVVSGVCGVCVCSVCGVCVCVWCVCVWCVVCGVCVCVVCVWCVCVSEFLCQLVTAKKCHVSLVHVHILSCVEHRQLKQLLDVLWRTSVASKVMKSGNSRFIVTLCNLPQFLSHARSLYSPAFVMSCLVLLQCAGNGKRF